VFTGRRAFRLADLQRITRKERAWFGAGQSALAAVIDVQRRSIELVEIEARVAALEKNGLDRPLRDRCWLVRRIVR
jgi:hypothetical protein